jgi:hypothetical protein
MLFNYSNNYIFYSFSDMCGFSMILFVLFFYLFRHIYVIYIYIYMMFYDIFLSYLCSIHVHRLLGHCSACNYFFYHLVAVWFPAIVGRIGTEEHY